MGTVNDSQVVRACVARYFRRHITLFDITLPHTPTPLLLRRQRAALAIDYAYISEY